MRYNREKKELTFDEAKDKALRLLEFRSHSERELSDKLKSCEVCDADFTTEVLLAWRKSRISSEIQEFLEFWN